MKFIQRSSALRGLFLTACMTAGLLAGSDDNAASGSSSTQVEWTGRIDSMPAGGTLGSYTIGGRGVMVTASTQVEAEKGPVAVGAMAEVRAVPATGGGMEATRLKITAAAGSPADNSGNSGSGSSGSGSSGSGSSGSGSSGSGSSGSGSSGSGSSGSGSSGSGSSGSGSSGSGSTNQPRVDLTELLGAVESGPSGTLLGNWRIAGRTVTVSSSTLVKTEFGPLVAGAFVEVKGVAQADGSIAATKVEVQVAANPGLPPAAGPAQITGTIQSLPADPRLGDWSVAGVTVRVTANTLLNLERGFPTPGAVVEVKGTLLATGVIEATVIEIKAGPGVTPTMRFVSSSGVLRSRTRGENSEWIIDDSKLRVSASTRIDDSLSAATPGAEIEFSGWDTKDSIQALSVRVKAPQSGSQAGAPQARVEGAVGEDFTSSAFTLGRTRVVVQASTKVELLGGPLAPGVWAQAKGSLQADGSLLAVKIETKPAPGVAVLADRVLGTIQARPEDSVSGEWKIGGRRVRISGETRFLTAAGDASTGAVVEVRGWKLNDDLIDAAEVEVHSPRR